MFVEVMVEEHDALPGTVMRWRSIPGATPRALTRVRWEPEHGPEADYEVVAVDAAGVRSPALGIAVEDSSAGTAILVTGGAYGLRLLAAGREVAEPYLLLSRDAVLDPGWQEGA